MHAKRDRPIDHIYRLRCPECGGERFAELGGDKQQRADAGAPVILACARCRAERPHEVVAP